jgi:hypothetical protein
LTGGLNASFTSRDVEHIGEELSDVLIYCTRLAARSGIDLPAAVQNDLFDSIATATAIAAANAASPSASHRGDARREVFGLHMAMGAVAMCFHRHPEAEVTR